MLRQFFGTDDVPFVRAFTAPAVPLPAPMAALPAKLITRSFSTLSEAAAEAKDARVFGGMHFREGYNAGVRQGTQIARFVVGHALKPVKGRGKK